MRTQHRFAVLFAAALIALSAALVLPHLGSGRSEAAVSRLQYSVGCLRDGRVSLYLLWSGGNASPKQQWIDVSLQNNGWQGGTFLSAGPFGQNAQSFDWNGLQPGSRHYVRINQMLANGTWDPSLTYQIETPSC